MENYKKYPSVVKLVKDELIFFLSESTIPGLKYIVNSKDVFERVAWAILLVVVFYLAGSVIHIQLTHWRSHPVETTIDEVGLPVDLLQFPAITVCDTEALKMPRKNRWMFVEKLLNSLELENPEVELARVYPGRVMK